MLTIIILAAILIGILLYNSFSWGFVAHKLFYWFILPIFPTAPNLTIYQFIGIFFFINCFVRVSSQSIKSEYREPSNELSFFFLSPWLTLLFSWFFYITFF
jgi:hypothetical protein